MSMEELQQLVQLAFRVGNVAGFQYSGEKSVTVTFRSQDAVNTFVSALRLEASATGKRYSPSVFGLSVLIQV